MNTFCYPITKRRPSRFHSRVQVTKILRVITQCVSVVAAWVLQGANRRASCSYNCRVRGTRSSKSV